MASQKEYKSIRRRDCDRFIEKKSEFIGYASPVTDEKSALAFIEEIRNKHADATHNVYAYILQGSGIARCSDDGEPSGTAGMPVLEVIKREDLCGVCVVVTRYFGGILLGAGGLVRAYAKAAKMAIDKAQICSFVLFTEFELSCGYADYEKIKRDLDAQGAKCDGTDFRSDVVMHLACRENRFDVLSRYVEDLTCGRVRCRKTGTRYDAE